MTLHAVDRTTPTGRTAGFTLLEMLAALVVFALSASLVSAQLRRPGPEIRVARSAETLVQDLRRAQIESRRIGLPVRLEISGSGYAVPELALDRLWPENLRSQWLIRSPYGWRAVDGIPLSGRPLSRLDARIVLEMGDARRVVRVDPITGQIHVEA